MKINFETPPVSATESEGLAVRYAQAKRSPPRWRWRLVLLLLAIMPVYLLVRFLVGAFWQEAPGLVMMQSSLIRAGVIGHVTYLAPEGKELQRGEVLARVERSVPVTLPSGLQSTGTTPVTSDPREPALQEALGLAGRQRDQLQQRVNLMQKLRSQDAATVQEVQSAQLEVLQAQTQMARIRGELAQLQNERQRATLGVQQLAARNNPPTANMERKEEVVYMPYTGTVARHQVAEGEWIDTNTDLVSLLSTQAPVVHAYLSPKELDRASPGQQATLVFQDGGRVAAQVLGVTAEAERQPAESVSPLVPRNLSVVVRLEPLESLPERYRVFRLPLEVRFEGPKTWPWLNNLVAKVG
ncbi:HlyD family efflux transporter periplasmic adaptor subunit [Diaphorobacter aerolatus]|uniref:HlyD family efflux transporter periplasmic adaptor subunit n=1 Tax=Diaphorobacter aerolatus TaxID=1288495 RepID=A0A7H0GL87_9BURK|nr:HlyD family efflux transporter periplasmic adaptor subunit [Diaphorobacter aerolatus]QNP49053.1 HlyD family efflux transporter periplasmic adaptor subunit [Diaphorobacter aerolatus]